MSETNLEFQATKTDPESLSEYLRLFQSCFPTAGHFSEPYLRWLYQENPEGTIVGTDALENGRVVAHYVCAPALIRTNQSANPVKALLSLNTATLPSHQGRGLFTALANATYERAKIQQFAAVFGVANQNSVGGFSRKLGFQNVLGLEARLGVGSFPRMDWKEAKAKACFERIWKTETIRWRARNPSNTLKQSQDHDGSIRVSGKTNFPLIDIRAHIYNNSLVVKTDQTSLSCRPFHLVLGSEPKGTARYRFSLPIPDRLKPSPLRFIYRNLQDPSEKLDPDSVLFTFLDFDAY